jgi:hypothetical protein
MNMVGSAASERSSSHPKGPKEQQRPEGDNTAPTALPSESERVDVPAAIGVSGVTSFAVPASAEPA